MVVYGVKILKYSELAIKPTKWAFMKKTTSELSGGIGATNRAHLERLHREARGPFTASDAAEILGVSLSRARRLVRYLADRGWLDRVRRGIYVTVPLDAHRSGRRTADPWVVAATVFAPSYIGGWSAAEHWDLTEQIFRDVLVVTATRPRERTVTLQGTTFHLRRLAGDKHFGLTRVWREARPVNVSDPTRTLIDILGDPAIGGGIRHVADIVDEYLHGEHRSDDLLMDYGDRLGNRTAFKRLGYIIETRGIDAPRLVDACLARRSHGIGKLDPSIEDRGRIVTRWGIAANAHVVDQVHT